MPTKRKYSFCKQNDSHSCYACCASKMFPDTNVTHCLFYDGKKLFDPHHGEVEFKDYELKEWWPLFDWKKA